MANDLESRKKAYELIYRLYLEKEYARPHPSKMWLSIFDALPETVTLLVERTAVEGGRWKVEGRSNPATSTFDPPLSTLHLPPPSPSLHPPPSTAATPVGALTVVFDSPMGLPADKLYKPELDALRASGRRLAEVVSLGVADDAGVGSEVLVKLFDFAYFVARGIRGATDFVNTVNPRHARFYERLMLFAPAGPERDYEKVGGAPAVLLRLDFDVAEAQRQLSVGSCQLSEHKATGNSRSIYGQFRAVWEERKTIAALAGQLRPMTGEELDYFLVAETDLLAQAAPEQRAYVQTCHPLPEAALMS